MKIIKNVLEEELKKAILAQKECEAALAALPRGVLVKKFVKGYQYCYLMSREKGKVRFEYKGKLLGKDITHYDRVKKDRARYRQLLAELKKRITCIKKILRGELRVV
jgi:translation initiation factor 1 (eIF-1/SUI1)